MGHEGMKASLTSREVIADSVELMMRAHCYDALLAMAGCDKSLPGMLMVIGRLNLPSVFLYGGTINAKYESSAPNSRIRMKFGIIVTAPGIIIVDR